MPTTEQLFKTWMSHTPDEEYSVQGSYRNLNKGAINMKFTGKKIGVIIYDKKSHDLKIIPDEKAFNADHDTASPGKSSD